MEIGVVVSLAVMAIACAAVWWIQEQRVRQLQEERGRAWAHEDRLQERIEELERQIDELHGQGFIVPPAEPAADELPEGVEIPEPVEKWIDAGEFDEEAEQEFRLYAQHKLQERPELEGQPDELLEAIRG